MRTFKASRQALLLVCALLVPTLARAAEPQFQNVGYYLTQSGYPVEVMADTALSEGFVNRTIEMWQRPDGFLRPDQAMNSAQYAASLSTARASRAQDKALFAGSCTLYISDPRSLTLTCDD